jgi:hypothetical protein
VNGRPLRTRFAHKPTCIHTRARILRVGGAQLCRGCASLWTGVAVGSLGAATGAIGSLAGFALLAIGLLGLHPRAYAALPNLGRDASRFALGAAPAPAMIGAWRAGHWYPAAVALWCAGVVVVVAMRKRRARSRHTCEAVAVVP